ncbi:ATP-binding protein [Ruminococcus sp. CLA-AA-H200]|uniref:ATP-binding protein n=1 Tax=Ruminococcus turbiniformis TaxID=2881258 RepID=A0ABS8FXF2_9FIRM|nr:ATP-binding protein [Ruminococcus turbiniformis]MCC2254706.1 ATP-binding protein [Ruminococcus turbiniformis]
MRTNELMLYKGMECGDILKDMTFLMENHGNEYYNREDLRSLLFECVNRLLELSVSHGFEGNLWHTYLTFLLTGHENAYSTSCEIVGEVDGSINDIALHDFAIFKELFDYDFSELEKDLNADCIQILMDYRNVTGSGKVFNRRVKDRICGLAVSLGSAEDAADFKQKVTQFYKEFGVGKLGLHKAFRIEHPEGKEMEIVPITNIAHVHLDDLVGYEIAKKKLIDNTEAFVKGRRANNCLLFGDAGTGKSSSIKAILNQYYDQGLRMIEVYKHQFKDLNDVIAQVKNRNYKFIIYMDDLSFEEFEIEYKYLKAVIEGGLERKPENVLIYATSNRRHLIRETFRDKADRDEELHTNDTVQEKLSLVARFGVTIYFGSPDKKEFQQIVRVLADRGGIDMPEEELLLEANKWELSHGGLSGRTAQQFIDYLMGQEPRQSR